MNIFDYVNENFVENLTDTYSGWDRILDKGLVLPNDNYFDMPGLTVSVLTINGGENTVNAKVYIFGRYDISNTDYSITSLYPELIGYLNQYTEEQPTEFPVDFEQKITTVKMTNLKMSSFPVEIDIDEGYVPAAVPA